MPRVNHRSLWNGSKSYRLPYAIGRCKLPLYLSLLESREAGLCSFTSLKAVMDPPQWPGAVGLKKMYISLEGIPRRPRFMELKLDEELLLPRPPTRPNGSLHTDLRSSHCVVQRSHTGQSSCAIAWSNRYCPRSGGFLTCFTRGQCKRTFRHW